jgi:hypothetical protein
MMCLTCNRKFDKIIYQMSGFLESLKNFFTNPVQSQGQQGFFKHVIKCNRCGEEITVKIRAANDMSRVYGEDSGPSGAAFYVRKEILGSKCNNLIYLTAYFSENFNLISSDVTGGKIIE